MSLISYLLGKAYYLLGTQFCWKSPNLNNFDMKWSKSSTPVPVSWSSSVKIKGFNWRLIGNSYLVLRTHSAAKFEQVSSTNIGIQATCKVV